MNIKAASPDDAQTLTELTMRSKAHWGYSSEQMEAWREDLTITVDYISENHVFVLFDGVAIRGYYSFELGSPKTAKLDNLFVDPDFMGQGLGAQLMIDFLERAKSMNIREVMLDADPHVEDFYKKYGFKTVDHLKSSIPGRYLPIMKSDLLENSEGV